MSTQFYADQLCYERSDKFILRDVNFTLHMGEVLLVSGVNGAGKTTLLRLLSGLLRPSSGRVVWQGSELIYLGHQQAVKAALTCEENLSFYEALSEFPGAFSLDSVLEQVGLFAYRNTKVYALSAGQRQRLALARLLLTSTKLWILDEPFTALDTTGTALLENLLIQHCQQGGMTVVSSHQQFELPNVAQKKLTLTVLNSCS